MSPRASGQLRRGQVITTYGPGALIDLPLHSAIIGGLDTWGNINDLEEIDEARLSSKLESMTGVSSPRLYSPPPDDNDPRGPSTGIGAWRFPEWHVVQEATSPGAPGDSVERSLSRRLVHRLGLDDRRQFDRRPVVATRFVQACPKGHVEDINWFSFVHGNGDRCVRQLWLDERGTGGDLASLSVRCECGKSRRLGEASNIEDMPLGICRGRRPWLGDRVPSESCSLPNRLLTRTASNAYFAQVMRVLSLPERGREINRAVNSCWDDLQIVTDVSDLGIIKRKPNVTEALSGFSDEEVLEAIRERKSGFAMEKPVKEVELEAMLAAPEGFGDDVPVDQDFHARKLPESVWRKSNRFHGIESVIQLHRLREVLALVGFTRFESITPDINGEYETDVERAELALETRWFPAVENRGEGIFIQLSEQDIGRWLSRPDVSNRINDLARGHEVWATERQSRRMFPGGPYLFLHTLSHLIMQAFALRCGYPASSIRERIYADNQGGRFGILLYTGSPDAEGTLGGLVQQARYIEDHLSEVIQTASLCSNDPICAQHNPGESIEGRWLNGAACHGCVLVAETSCEMRNDYLDRALVVSTIGSSNSAFFSEI